MLRNRVLERAVSVLAQSEPLERKTLIVEEGNVPAHAVTSRTPCRDRQRRYAALGIVSLNGATKPSESPC